MRLVGRVTGGDMNTLEALRRKCINARVCNSAIIFDLPRERGKYKIPMRNAKLMIEAQDERGVVFCDSNGNFVRPYRKTGHSTNYFSMQKMVSVRVYAKNSTVSLKEHTIARNGSNAEIRSTPIWSGKARTLKWKCSVCGCIEGWSDSCCCSGEKLPAELSLPGKVKKFEKAVVAAKMFSKRRRLYETYY